MDLSSIRKLSESREGGLKKLASDIGMSESTMTACITMGRSATHAITNLPISTSKGLQAPTI